MWIMERYRSTTMTELILIRHAHSDIGKPPRLCGSSDVPLSTRGLAQLADVQPGSNIPAPPSALYCSPLRRAAETAGALGRAWNIDAVVDREIGEIHCGDFEGLPIEWVQRQHPITWHRNAAQEDDGFGWPGGETYAQFRERVVSALGRIAAGHRGERVAIVTHSGVIAQVLGILSGRRAAVWEKDRPDPFSFTDIVWNNTGPLRLVHFNRSLS